MGLLLDGNPIEARQALEIGLVNEVVQNSPIEAAIARAKEWTSRASVAARAIKQGVLQVSRAKMAAEVEESLEVIGRSLQPPICARAWRRSWRREAHASRGIER